MGSLLTAPMPESNEPSVSDSEQVLYNSVGVVEYESLLKVEFVNNTNFREHSVSQADFVSILYQFQLWI